MAMFRYVKRYSMPTRAALPRLVAVVGPTASGKTDVAIALAKRFNGEVISADSRQFYRGTGIGAGTVVGEWKDGKTGKWKAHGRRVYVAQGVPHHLIDFLSPKKKFTASEFKDHVVKIARGIVKRGHVPILAGGTGMFVSAVLENYSMPDVPPDTAFRARMDKKSIDALYRELARKDPAYAARIPTNNRRYATRALEVLHATGKRFSELQTKGEPLFDILTLRVERPRAELFARIDARVDDMVRRGLVEETKRVMRVHGDDAPALTGLGHRQVAMYLRGELSLEAAIALAKSETRKYAKRQETWFKRMKDSVPVRDTMDAVRAIEARVWRSS